MEVVELEAHLLGPTDVTGIVNVLAKNACNGSGYRFVFIKRKGSMRVCEKIWKETDYKELQELIERMHAKQGRLLATTE